MSIRKMSATFDVQKISKGFGIEFTDTMDLMTNGRFLGFIMERRICHDLCITFVGDMIHSYDAIDGDNAKYEIRTLTKKVSFAPSKTLGAGRKFDEAMLFEKMNEVDFYIVSVASKFSDRKLMIDYYIIDSKFLKENYSNGNLGKNASVSRKKFFTLIESA